MDDSSVGRGKDYGAFQRVLRNLDAALKSLSHILLIDYYQGFNNAIGTFGGVLQHIHDSQSRTAQMKISLKKCKQELLEKRTDLLNMWHKSQQHKEMLIFLETIEEIRTVPEKLKALVNSKHVYTAAKMLVDALKTVNKEDMLQIGALDDIRRTLSTQKNALYDLLVEEIHNHLYLKNSFCENRWSEYIHDQQKLPEIAIKPKSFMDKVNSSEYHNESISKEEDLFALDEDDVVMEDPDINPETDSYYYMEIIMEALAMLGQVPAAIETVQERLPFEIYALVDKTIADVEERHSEQYIISVTSRKNTLDDSAMYCLDKANSETKNEILKDLLWTLYSKMEAVLRGQHFLETCARRIKKRITTKEVSSDPQDIFHIYQFHEIWQPVQVEIRSLLQSYLTSQERTPTALQQSTLTPDDASGKSGFSSTREKNKQLFRFTESPQDLTLEQAYQSVRSNLHSSFKKQVPGFNFNESQKARNAPHSSVIDKYASDMASKGHKVLVKPDAYNVSVLLKPTMAFLQRMNEVFPNYDDQSSEGFGSFLDDFAINVFLPQIEEKVMQLIHHAAVGMDAFQDERNYKNYSKFPIVKSAVALISIIQSLCRIMHSMPFHTDEYVRMIEVVLLKYYEKCYHRFYSMVVKGSLFGGKEFNVTEMNINTSGDWAQDEDLVCLLTQNPLFDDDNKIDSDFVESLIQSEIKLEIKLKGDRQLEAEELIFDSKRLIALGRLYHSLKWFVREIWELRTSNQPTNKSIPGATNILGENEANSEEIESEKARGSKRWSRDDSKEVEEEDPSPVILSLRGEVAGRFDTLLTTYQQLAETCLFTLRLEARCHTMYYLEMVIREGNYYLEDETYEPDPYVITLNSDLMEIDDCINASLPAKDEMFAFDGLPALIIHLLISEATYIKRMNKNGVQKMTRNILALQQNLSNFVPSSQSSTLDRASKYYQLFNLGSKGIVQSIRESGPLFTFDEYRVILGLIYDINREEDSEPKSATVESFSTSNNRSSSAEYSEWLMKLDEVMADYEI
ncbi:Sec8 exocyst complex component-specific domain-containing protein [Spinellus fusiger]|nr:Sec8 exocyst complex component-specific domain-containing protein [Spinellus fusiger]